MEKTAKSADKNPVYQQFLDNFCKTHNGPLSEDSSLPIRITTWYLSTTEAEGECLDWSLQYLLGNHCPSPLASSIARAVADIILVSDFSPYIDPEPPEVDDADEKGDPPPRLLAVKFARAVFSEVHAVCEQWRSGMPGIGPFMQAHDVSTHAIKNTRRKMEDKHVMIPYLNQLFGLKEGPPQSFYAVFDGHGGTDAAYYAATHLHCNIVKSEAFTKDLTMAIRQGFETTDANFLHKAKSEHLPSGTTGVCALVRGKEVHIAWLGDSQVLLIRNGKPVELMKPHKPEREDERERIEKLGGCVVWFGAWRVNGTLSVSRAIGDAGFKPYISGEPDLYNFELEEGDDYLVLACDGLWDTVKPSDIVGLVDEHLSENKGDRTGVAHKLVKTARDNGSGDNITVVVVFLKGSDHTRREAAEVEEKVKLSDKDSSDESLDNRKKQADKNDNTTASSEKDNKNDSNRGSSKENSDSLSNPHSGSSDMLYSSNNDNVVSKSDSQRPVVSDSQEDISELELSANLSPAGDGNISPAPLSPAHVSPLNLSPTYQSPETSLNQTEIQSDTSVKHLVLMSKTAMQCLNNRRAKRNKNGSFSGSKSGGKNGSKNGSKSGSRSGRNGRTKENRRMNRLRIGGSGLLTQRQSAPPRSRSAESNLSLAQKSMLRSGDQIFELLTGCSPNIMRKAKGGDRWTVAVEIENGTAMFEDVKQSPVKDTERRKSDTTHLYKK